MKSNRSGIMQRSTLKGALALLLAWSSFGTGTAAAAGTGTGTAPAFVYSPYKDATISMNWNTNVISSNVTGQMRPVLSVLPAGVRTLTLAFATGECGSVVLNSAPPHFT